MKSPKIAFPWALLIVAWVLTFAPPSLAQRDLGRLSGTLKDSAGKPAEGVVLIVVHDDASVTPLKTAVNKKGKFTFPYLAVGRWKIETEDEALFLESMVYVHRNAKGIKTGEIEGRGHPVDGLPAIEIRLNGRGQLSLVLGESGAKQPLGGRLRLQAATGPLKVAVDLYEAGDMAGSVEATEAILAETPDLIEARFVRGAALSKIERFAEAEPELRAAVAAKPEIPRIQGMFALVLISNADRLAADGEVQQAHARYSEAIPYLEEQIRRVPEESSYKVNLVVALEGAGETARLEQALRAVLDADPENRAVAMRLAGLYGSSGRPEEAARVVEQTGLTGRDAANALYNIAAELYNDGKNDQAEVYAVMVREADPAQPEVLSLLGYLRLAAGDAEAALSFFRDFVERVPAEQSTTEQGLIDALLANQ